MQQGYAFISYSTKNQAAADAIRELLKRKGIATWMAPGDIPAGSKYAQVINRAVKECSCFVLVLTEDAQSSVWVAKEVERAINYRRPIIPVQLEDVTLNDEFELYISSDQLVAIRKIDEDSEEVQRLLAGIIPYTGATASPSPVCNSENEQMPERTIAYYTLPHPEVKRRLLLIVDTSENMVDDYIEATEKTVQSLRQMFRLHFETTAAIDILAYGDECQWLEEEGSHLVAKGVSNAGKALSCLATYGDSLPEDSACCIIWVTARYPADEWRSALDTLKGQAWFERAYRFAFALGNDVDYGFLYQFTGGRDAVFQVEDLTQLSRLSSSLSFLGIKALKEMRPGGIRAVLQELEQQGKIRETFTREVVQESPQLKPVHIPNPKVKKSQPEQLCYFGAKRAQKLFPEIPYTIIIPPKTNVILSNVFETIVSTTDAKPKDNKRSLDFGFLKASVVGDYASVGKIIVPEGVIEIKDHAFSHLKILQCISLPSTLKQIGKDAFILGPDAYVDCEMGSAAYAYCKERGIRTSADMELWRQYGRCQYCGGNFSFLKNCKLCGKHKDY